MATVVVLNGTSSSGKTALARATQDIADRLFLNFSIDSILYALPQRAIDRIRSGADIADLRYPDLVRAFYACVRELLALNYDLVIDNAVTARYHAELLLSAIGSHKALLVGLHCPATTLRQREHDRGDRRVGLAEQQIGGIHTWLEYDLVIDTSAMSPEQAAAQVVEALNKDAGGGLERTRAKLEAG